MPYIITPMTHEHIPQIAALELLCFAVPWSKDAFANEIKNNLASYNVMLDGEKVIGYYGLWHVLDEGHITNIAIHPDYRRKGLGSEMLSHMINNAELVCIKHLTLEVRASNTAARALYSKHGFIPAGIRHKYYSNNNEDAVIMNKTF